MATGYEVKMYQDIGQIAASLKLIAGSLKLIAEREAMTTPVDESVWVIETYVDGGINWWANELGWVEDRRLATVFTDDERYTFQLPLDGQWVDEGEAHGNGRRRPEPTHP